MKNRTKIIFHLLIYSLSEEMSTIFIGKKQKIEYCKYFFGFVYNSENETKYNFYKAVSKVSGELSKTITEENRKTLVEELTKHRTRTTSQISKNRITIQADDTCDDKNHSRKGNKSHRVWDNCLKKIIKTHNTVFLSMTVGTNKFCYKYILDYRLWTKGAKKKPHLFIDMIKELKKFLLKNGFSEEEIKKHLVVTFDSGYSYNSVLEKLDNLGFSFVGKFHHKYKCKIDGTTYHLPDWLRRRFRANNFNIVHDKYKKTLKEEFYKWVNIENFKWKFILTLFPRKGNKKRARRLIVTNMKRPYFTVLERYRQRFYIELVFRDLKQHFLFKSFQQNDLNNNFEKHLTVCIKRYNMIQKVRRERGFRKKTVGQILKSFRKELDFMGYEDREKWFSSCVTEDFKTDP